MFKLKNKVAINIPLENNAGEKIEDTKIDNEIKLITSKFGGCSVTENEGFWVSNATQSLMIDKNKNYEWYFDNMNLEAIESISNIVELLINQYQQECISIIYKNQLCLVENRDDVVKVLSQSALDELNQMLLTH